METPNQPDQVNSTQLSIIEEAPDFPADFCLTCDGTGRFFVEICHHCEGSGRWCPVCRGVRLVAREMNGYEVFVECVCRKEKRIRRILDTRIPAKCAVTRRGFEGFEPDRRHPKQQRVFDVLSSDEMGLLLFGATDVGKSHFGWLAFAEAVRRGTPAFAANLDSLMDETTAFTFSSGETAPPRPSLLQADLRSNSRATVFLDEIDKVKKTENALRFFFGLIDTAVYFGHRLILTSNVEPEILEQTWNSVSVSYGGPICRRIKESCAVFDMRLANCLDCLRVTHIEKTGQCALCESRNLSW